MVATSGDRLITEDAVSALKELLLPLATVLTPNIPEAEILSGMTIRSAADMEAAARAISEQYGCAVLCKGGHQLNDANDLLWKNGTLRWFNGRRIDNPNTHGTAAPSPAPSRRIWPRALIWRRLWRWPRRISPARWRRA